MSSNSHININTIDDKKKKVPDENDFFEKCKKRAKNNAMAGLMAVLMKEIAIMEAEANPDDDDEELPPEKQESCDQLEVFEEYRGELQNVSSKMYKLNTNYT